MLKIKVHCIYKENLLNPGEDLYLNMEPRTGEFIYKGNKEYLIEKVIHDLVENRIDIELVLSKDNSE